MIIKNRDDLTRTIKTAMAARGVSVNDMAAALASGQPATSRTINKSDLRVTQLQAIAAALDCDLYIALLPKDTSAAARVLAVRNDPQTQIHK